jgi:hypothetical protein
MPQPSQNGLPQSLECLIGFFIVLPILVFIGLAAGGPYGDEGFLYMWIAAFPVPLVSWGLAAIIVCIRLAYSAGKASTQDKEAIRKEERRSMYEVLKKEFDGKK